MKTIEADNLLFKPFIDAYDMTLCCSAQTTAYEIEQIAGEHGLYFPLHHDPYRSLADHISAMEFAPASARFGPYVDNILGMNWRLGSGKVVRVGERIIKSTTGYDLFRFLLHSGERYGTATDYVLRLRPSSEHFFTGAFHGVEKSLLAVQHELRTSSWSHWIDSCDLVVRDSGSEHVEITVNHALDERSIFFEYFHGIAKKTACTFDVVDGKIHGTLPPFTIKTIVSQAPETARRCVNEFGGTCRVLLINGLILAYVPDRTKIRALLPQLERDVCAVGGHLYGHDCAEYRSAPSAMEIDWSDKLERLWKEL